MTAEHPRAKPGGVRPSVLQLCTRFNIGGPARHVLALAEGLADDYDLSIAAGRPDPGEGELGAPSSRVERVPLGRAVHPIADVRSVVSVRRLLAERGTQVLNTHMAKAGAVGRLAAQLLRPRPRTVHTYHGHIYEGHFPDRVARSFLQLERLLARRTDLLVAVSPEVRDALLDLGVGTEEQWRVAPVVLDLDPFLAVEGPSGRLRASLDLEPSTPLVAVVGRLAPVKNHRLLLEAVAGLPGVHLAVLGDGELREHLWAQAVASGIHERVHFVGWWTDMPSALSDVDVVALTSHVEGTPVSLIEASAAARPVVATRVGGVPSVVQDGVGGLLVPPGRLEGLREALAALLGDARERARLGAAGRRDVHRRFARADAVAATRAVYDELLA